MNNKKAGLNWKSGWNGWTIRHEKVSEKMPFDERATKEFCVLFVKGWVSTRSTYAHLTFLGFGFFYANRCSRHCQQKRLSELRELFWMRQKRLLLNQKRLVGFFFYRRSGIAICQKYKFSRWKFECDMNQMLPTWIRVECNIL